ncbi:MAG: M3 family oligoendopeptidase [Flammeovirgaceae bacterium]
MKVDIAKKLERSFIPKDFKLSDWEQLKPYFDQLLAREISSKEELEQWMLDNSELSSVLSENVAWRYINMTCNTKDEALADFYKQFVTELQPKIAPLDNQLDQKLLGNTHFDQLTGRAYEILGKRIRKDVEIYREENVPLQAELRAEQQQFGALNGAMTVEIDGKEMTLQQAGTLLESQDRAKREEAYRKIHERRLQDAEKLDELFSSLVKKRDKIAKNADFANYRDYTFKSMGRFDYTPEDCFQFHDAIQTAIVPLLNELAEKRKQDLNLSELKPWDKKVDVTGKPPLKAFENVDQLIDQSIECFHRLDPFLGECLAYMKTQKHLDLDSRIGKAPGGYNYPLMETGIPFIFMNATSTVRDLVTLMHEGGHAVHSILIKDLDLVGFKHLTPEIAELASMTMELLSMDHWNLFFEDAEELKRAKANHLEDILSVLPWIATIDKFQHWIYENPNHTIEERTAEWNNIFNAFSDEVTDWTGLAQFRDISWQRQIHLFEFPFYYIEYAIAQLGAIAIWKNYRENPKKALNQYLDALKLGYTKSIGEIYETAGVRFDFSAAYMQELIDFVRKELAAIHAS